MLDFLRKGAKSLVAKALILLLIASFAVWGIGDIFRTSLDTPVIIAGDSEVEASVFHAALVRQQNQMVRQAGQAVSFADMRAAGVDNAILGGLARDAVASEELRSRGLAVSDAAVRDRITSNPTFQDGQGVFNQFTYQSVLAQNGFNPIEFERLSRTLLGQSILQSSVQRTPAALPGAGARIATYRGEERQITTVLLTPETAPDPGTPDDATLDAWFEENKTRFREPERRWGKFLHVDPVAIAAAAAPTEEALRAEYEANKDRFTVQPSRLVEQIVFPDLAAAEAGAARVTSGEITFADLASEVGIPAEDLSLGEVRPGDLPDNADKAVFGTEDIGLAGPVDDGGSALLFNVVTITEGGAATFEEMREALALMLGRQVAEAKAPEIANQVDDLRAGGMPLAEIAEKTELTLGTFDGLARNGSFADRSRATGIAATPAFIEEVFEALDHEERDQIQTQNGGYLLVHVDRIEEAHQPALADIRDRVVAAWQREQRFQALEERAAEMIARLGEVELGQIATEAGLIVNDRPAFSRLQAPPDLGADLVEDLFTADQGDGAHGRAADGSGVLVGQVMTITPLDADKLETDAAELEAALSESLGRDLLEYYMRALETEHNALVDYNVVEQVFESLGQARSSSF